jgi:NAD(P)-dependent dehydrogenase (short-subunit alcohol dehydrogenase family)
MKWSDKVVVVTGGASGIGAAAVKEFVDGGAAVAIFDINQTAGAALAEHYQSSGAQVTFYHVDVADAAACHAAIGQAIARYGRIDCLLNNAVSFISKGLDATTADWERSLGVNVRGYANMVQACFEPMRKQGGAIVNISSISAFVAQPDRWTYNASKGAIISLTKCQALDLAPHKIRVNAISPGWIWTPEVQKAANNDRATWEPVWGRYHMLRRLGEPREVARAVLFLCSDDASFITATNLSVDGGYMGLGSEGLGETSTFAGSA